MKSIFIRKRFLVVNNKIFSYTIHDIYIHDKFPPRKSFTIPTLLRLLFLRIIDLLVIKGSKVENKCITGNKINNIT